MMAGGQVISAYASESRGPALCTAWPFHAFHQIHKITSNPVWNMAGSQLKTATFRVGEVLHIALPGHAFHQIHKIRSNPVWIMAGGQVISAHASESKRSCTLHCLAIPCLSPDSQDHKQPGLEHGWQPTQNCIPQSRRGPAHCTAWPCLSQGSSLVTWSSPSTQPAGKVWEEKEQFRGIQTSAGFGFQHAVELRMAGRDIGFTHR